MYIYDFASLSLLATITGFDQPQGECSNKSGDVWIADANAQTVYELTRTGHLQNELAVPNGYPVACAWDPSTGNLAVIAIAAASSGSGFVLIFPKGSGTPTEYQNSTAFYYYFGGYDPSGDLFFDGTSAYGKFLLAELSKGGKSASTIAMKGSTIYYPGMVQWAGAKTGLLVGDQSCGNTYSSCLYPVKISGKTGTAGSAIDLKNSGGGEVCDLVQGVLSGTKLAGSDNDFCGSTPSSTYVWNYPAGGAPVLSNAKTDVTPVGAAVSRPGGGAESLASEDLLYVTNKNSEVTIYNFETRALVGVITSLQQPLGECVDAKGNVYVADYTAQEIVEFAHGGTKAIEKLNDHPDSPYACAVDPTTGNLAVANDDGGSSGNIAIWSGSSRTTYTDSKIGAFAGCAYNSSGALLASSLSNRYPYTTYFAWLPRGGHALANIDIPGPSASRKWLGILGVQWDGKFFALDDGRIYRIALLHGQAYYIGSTQPRPGSDGPYAFYDSNSKDQATQAVGGVDSIEYGDSVDYWPYPAGGYATTEITHGIDGAFGVAISLGR